MKKYCLVLALIFAWHSALLAQDATFLQVHFLYGSKPLKAFKNTEQKWFGGMIGGHVGIAMDSNKILNILPKGHFHYVAHGTNKHSIYRFDDFKTFYEILGNDVSQVKKAIVYIPISPQQKVIFDSIANAYTSNTPYDYAFLGMRCGGASHDILGQLGIVQNWGYRKTFLRIFYPKILRKKILKKAKVNHWKIYTEPGCTTRKWEQD
jgi:hypothetical protein